MATSFGKLVRFPHTVTPMGLPTFMLKKRLCLFVDAFAHGEDVGIKFRPGCPIEKKVLMLEYVQNNERN